MKRIPADRGLGAVLLAAALSLALWPCRLGACPYSFRESGFVDLGRDYYGLFCLVGPDGGRPLVDLFETASKTLFRESNVRLAVVDVEQDAAHGAVAYYNGLKKKSLPFAVLIAPDGRKRPLSAISRKGNTPDDVLLELKKVVSSPGREDFKKHAIEKWCVALLIEGDDKEKNAAAGREIASACKDISGAMTAMGRTVDSPPFVMRVQAKNAEEQMLLWSVGFDPARDSTPAAAVLYGRGKRFGPLLQGDELCRESFMKLFSLLGYNCSCTTDPRILFGPVIPATWGYDEQTAAIKALGFDPANPMVKMEIASAIPMRAEPVESLKDLPAEAPNLLGYQEIVFDPEAATEEQDAQRYIAQPEPVAASAGAEAQPATAGDEETERPVASQAAAQPQKDATVAVPLRRNTGVGLVVALGVLLALTLAGAVILAIIKKRAK